MDHPCSSSKRAHYWAWLSHSQALLVILIISTIIELVLQGADRGIWGAPRWRALAYEYGGFWRGLLGTWQPNYTAQPAIMFASYGFLHGGFIHLLFNMITLISLGRLVIERAGHLRFLAIYALVLLGGATGFALLSTAVRPMVGASGALFGLVGILLAWEYKSRRLVDEALGPVLQVIAILIAINLVMYWAMDGNLAWETHLGGFITGWLAGWLFRDKMS